MTFQPLSETARAIPASAALVMAAPVFHRLRTSARATAVPIMARTSPIKVVDSMRSTVIQRSSKDLDVPRWKDSDQRVDRVSATASSHPPTMSEAAHGR